MGLISFTNPTVGQDNSTEEPLIVTALTTLKNLVNGNIDEANIKAAARIALTQLANLSSGKLIVGDASNRPTAVTPSGDVTISNTGVTTIGTDKVTTAKILNSNVTTAKIADDNVTASKIALGATTDDGSSAVSGIAAATWTNDGCIFIAPSDGIYAVTCHGSLLHVAPASAGAHAAGSRLQKNAVTITGSTLTHATYINTSTTQWSFSHTEFLDLAASDVITHQVYCGIINSQVLANGFYLKALKIANT